MNFIMLATVLLFAHLSYGLWRTVRIQETRWRLAALRDELRWLAIQDDEFRASLTFAHLDRVLPKVADAVDRFSLWSTLDCSPGDQAQASFAEVENDMKRWPEAAKIFQAFGEALVDHLRARHWIITVLGVVVRGIFHKDPVRENARKVALSGTPSMPAAA